MGFFKDTIISGDLEIIGSLNVTENSGFDAETLNGLSQTAFIRANISNNLNKNKFQNIVLKNFSESKNILGSVSGLVDMNITNGNIFTVSILGNTTFNFISNTSIGSVISFSIIITNNNLGFITWPSNIKWPDGIKPALSGYGIDVLSFLSIDDGTTWLGALCGMDFL